MVGLGHPYRSRGARDHVISRDPCDHACARVGYVIGLISQMNLTGIPYPKTDKERLVPPDQPVQLTHAPEGAASVPRTGRLGQTPSPAVPAASTYPRRLIP